MRNSLLNHEYQYFLVAAECRTFLAAADQLGLSQPALSRAMDRLEEQVGFKVFRRTRVGIQLTREGRELQQRLRHWNETMESSVQSIRDSAISISGDIRVGGHRSVLEDFILPHHSALVAQFPLVRFHLESMSSRDAVQAVMDRKIDFAIAVNPVEYRDLIVRPLAPTKALFFCQVENPQRIYLSPQMIEMAKLLRVLRRNFLDESHLCFIDDYGLIAQLVQQGGGGGLLPDHVGRRYALKVHPLFSSQLKMNFDLRWLVRTDEFDEKRKKISRFIESVVRRGSS